MSAPTRRCELNVTPLIDVLLVLLILFMILVPKRERALASELSRGDAAGSEPRTAAAVVVDVAAGELLLDRIPMRDAGELARRLRERISRNSDLAVLVRVAENVPYSRVIDALDAADGAGARRVGLVGGASSQSSAFSAQMPPTTNN